MNSHKKKSWIAVACVIVAIGLFVWFFQWLWNILLPDILGVKSINYWQSLGILLLSKILFGGFGDKTKCRNRTAADGERKDIWRQKSISGFCGTDEEHEREKQIWKQKFEAKFYKPESNPEKES